MVDCLDNPEICEADKKYENEKKKFFKDREDDAREELIDSEKLLNSRQKDEVWKQIYPINNYDFNYKNYTINSNNPFKIGIKNTPTITNLIDSTIKMQKFNDTLFIEPTPNENTKLGDDISTINNSEITNSLKNIKNTYNNNPLPYPSFLQDFPPDKYPTDKEHSSSYFIKIGNCPVKINSKNHCENLGYTWKNNSLKSLDKGIKNFLFSKNNEPRYKKEEYKRKQLLKKNLDNIKLHRTRSRNIPINNYKLCYQNGRVGIGNCIEGEKIIDNISLSKKKNNNIYKEKNFKTLYKYKEEDDEEMINEFPKKNPYGMCYKPKFMYIDNSAKGFFGMKGYTNSIINDIMSITPDKLLPILAGKSDSNIVTNCPNEEFINYNAVKQNNWKDQILQSRIIKFIFTSIFISLLITILIKYL